MIVIQLRRENTNLNILAYGLEHILYTTYIVT